MILSWDLGSGASGNMILGALLSLVDERVLREGLEKLQVFGYELQISEVSRQGFPGRFVDVKVTEDQPHRHLSDIEEILEASGLSSDVIAFSREVFRRIAVAEAEVHGSTVEEIHFHEVGAVDAIVDVVGTGILLEALHWPKHLLPPVATGYGTVACAHGLMPVPAPATAKILAASDLKSYPGEEPFELLTPTGAAILSQLETTTKPCHWREVPLPGAGSHPTTRPNLLRLFLGEDPEEEQVLVETNIDNMTGEEFGFLIERLWEQGPRDVWTTSIMMKKQRPGVMVSILCDEKDVEAMTDCLFSESRSLGCRIQRLEKRELRRVFREGEIRRKLAQTPVGERESLEYEDLAKMARQEGRPLVDVKDEFLKKGELWRS